MKEDKNPILVLCDREEEYAGKMGDFLKEHNQLSWEIHTYTDAGEMLKSEKDEKICILVVAESTYGEELRKLHPLQIVMLNESGIREGKDIHQVDKYQKAEEVLREILSVYADIAHTPVPGLQKGFRTRLIGIYSPVRRCMQTTFALTMSQLLSASHKTLYLNFEHYAGLEGMMADSHGKDLADLLYFLNADRDKFRLRMRSMIRRIGNLDYIPPMKSGQNLLTVTREEWQKLLGVIDESGEYEFVIMDLTDSMQGLFEIMQNCTRIFTLTCDDRISQGKILQYEQLLSLYKFEDILDKTRKCSPPRMRRIPDEIEQYTKCEMADFVKMQIKEIWGEAL